VVRPDPEKNVSEGKSDARGRSTIRSSMIPRDYEIGCIYASSRSHLRRQDKPYEGRAGVAVICRLDTRARQTVRPTSAGTFFPAAACLSMSRMRFDGLEPGGTPSRIHLRGEWVDDVVWKSPKAGTGFDVLAPDRCGLASHRHPWIFPRGELN